MDEELLALAERCERATGPDRELDILIGLAIDLCADHGWPLRKSFGLSGMENLLRQAESHQNIWRTELPRYSASIDAAMTLIDTSQVGWCWNVKHFSEFSKPSRAEVFLHENAEPGDSYGKGIAATPALALCAAALKARATPSAAASNPLGAAPSPSSTVPGTPLESEDHQEATGDL